MSRKQELLYEFLTAVLTANVVIAANSVPSNVADIVALDDGYHVRNTGQVAITAILVARPGRVPALRRGRFQVRCSSARRRMAISFHDSA